MAERKAREAAAATADRAAAEEERVAAVEERAAAANKRRICHTEFIVELAVLCDCVSELEEENMDLQDTVMGRYEFLPERSDQREGLPINLNKKDHEGSTHACMHHDET